MQYENRYAPICFLSFSWVLQGRVMYGNYVNVVRRHFLCWMALWWRFSAERSPGTPASARMSCCCFLWRGARLESCLHAPVSNGMISSKCGQLTNVWMPLMAQPENLQNAAWLCPKPFVFFLRRKIWQISNHKKDMAKKWYMSQMPSSNVPSEKNCTFQIWIVLVGIYLVIHSQIQDPVGQTPTRQTAEVATSALVWAPFFHMGETCNFGNSGILTWHIPVEVVSHSSPVKPTVPSCDNWNEINSQSSQVLNKPKSNNVNAASSGIKNPFTLSTFRPTSPNNWETLSNPLFSLGIFRFLHMQKVVATRGELLVLWSIVHPWKKSSTPGFTTSGGP